MLKNKIVRIFLSYLIISAGLFFAGLISFLLVLPSKSSTVESSEKKVQGITKVEATTIPNPQPSASVVTKQVVKTLFYSTPSPISSTPMPTPVTSPVPSTTSQNTISSEVNWTLTPTPSPTQATQTYQVNVFIDGSSNFLLSVSEGVDQCTVLSRALSEGKITSLNMRYDSNLETYAVYQINGIGKENAVWWTYKVNGQSPNQGCSYIKAKNNDTVEWKYIGS